MICKQCNGSGKTYNPGYGEENCCRCHGTGEIKQTEQEWLQTATTEQLAEALTKVVLDLISWNNDPKPSEVRNVLKAWLKQPHTVKE